MGQPILARGDSHRLPHAFYSLDATEPGSWCYAPADSHAGRDEIEVPPRALGSPGPSGATDVAGTVRALHAALCPTWTDEDQRELDKLREHVRLCSLGDRPQHPGVEKMRRLDELEQRARAARGQVRPVKRMRVVVTAHASGLGDQGEDLLDLDVDVPPGADVELLCRAATVGALDGVLVAQVKERDGSGEPWHTAWQDLDLWRQTSPWRAVETAAALLRAGMLDVAVPLLQRLIIQTWNV